MILAYWCVLIAMLMPWVAASYAKMKGGFTLEDNRQARVFMAKLEGEAARANAVQLNSFEIFPAFAAAVIIATLSGVSDAVMNTFAVIFIISRVIYFYCYVKDRAAFRSIIWGVGLLCILALFVAGIF